MNVLDKLKKNKEKEVSGLTKSEEELENEVRMHKEKKENETTQIVEEVQANILGAQLSGKKSSEELQVKKNISKDTDSVVIETKEKLTEPSEPNQKKPFNTVFFTPQMKTYTPIGIDLSLNSGFTLEKRAFVIGVCGGTCAGKEEFAIALKGKFEENSKGVKKVAIIPEEIFYKEAHSFNSTNQDSDKNLDHDHPDAIDWLSFADTVSHGSLNHSIDKSFLNRNAHQNLFKNNDIPGKYHCDIIIIHGTRIFHNEKLRGMINLKVFLDTDEDIRLGRRIYRDVFKRKLEVKKIIERYLRFVKADFDRYVFPSKKYADIIIPNYGGDEVESYKTGVEPENNKQHQTILMIVEQVAKNY